MGKFTGVLLASDFDNTIVNTAAVLRGETTVALPGKRTLDALTYFMAEGGRFSIATGRALAAFIKHASEVPMNAPAVLCNGAALYDFAAGCYLDTNYLNDAARQRVQQLLDRFPAVAAEAYNAGNTIYAVQPNEVTRFHTHLTHVETEERPTLLDVDGPLGKLLLEGSHGDLEQIRQFLTGQSWSGDYEVFFSAENLLEMTARGANKGGMVRRLAQRLGIGMEHVYCAGDESNDISMLQAAAQGFAPANCVEAVRLCGATVVSAVADDAIADVVEILDRKY